MDLTDSPQHAALRGECRAWLQENLPWEYGSGLPPRFEDLAEEVAFGRRWQDQLARGRWVGVAWPLEYGGRAAGPAAHFVVQEELARARAPELVGRIGVNLVGPTLLTHGSPEQRARWLPDILAAGSLWCQLFSEPDAGSDLASLRTRAVRDESASGWRLDGQKVWTSYAQFADFGLCLARTDPDAAKHHGISAFAVDMSAPGVEVRPLVQSTGEAEFNEVFLDGVLLADDALIGPLNEGWRVSQSTLGHERGVNPRQLVIHIQHLEELLRLADITGALSEERLRQQLAEAYVEVKLFQLHNWRSLTARRAGRVPGTRGVGAEVVLVGDVQASACDRARRPRRRRRAVERGFGSTRRRRMATFVALLPVILGVRRHERDPAQRDRRTSAGPTPGAEMTAGTR